MRYSLAFTREQHKDLYKHLFPGDDKEAVAILLCGRRDGDEAHRFMVLETHFVPHEKCSIRRKDYVQWPTKFIVPIMEKAGKKNLALFKIHSHPTGFPKFSNQDDKSDGELFPSIYAYMDSELPHGSAVMLPEGKIFGRVFHSDSTYSSINLVSVIGDDIDFWSPEIDCSKEVPEFAKRNAQALGPGTFQKFKPLKIAVIGASGTGSLVAEELARLGVGQLVIVDPGTIKGKNLNRIINSKEKDIGRPKVEVLKEAILEEGTGTEVTAICGDLWEKDVAKKVAECDAAFGCMDSMSGRFLLNRISTFYLQPYIDIGIRLDADGKGGIDQICGSVHYLQPGKSSLRTRGLTTEDRIRAEMLRKFEPDSYQELLNDGYIKGVEVDRPAVMPVNMFYSGLAVIEFLARIHNFRHDPNCDFASTTISLTGNFSINKKEGVTDMVLKKYIGRGDMPLFLDLPHFSKPKDGLKT